MIPGLLEFGWWDHSDGGEAAPGLGAKLVQLTSDAARVDAHRFYEWLGFTASHVVQVQPACEWMTAAQCLLRILAAATWSMEIKYNFSNAWCCFLMGALSADSPNRPP